MSKIQLRKAERKQAKLRIGIAAPSGAGKTYGALLLARGMASAWDKICVIDTEHGSAELYSNLGDYNVITLTSKIGFMPKNYVEAIHTAEEAGMEVIIIDSLSHAWNEEGGLLDQADKLQGKTDRFRVWAELTPQHRLLVNSMLQSEAHIIATMRSKQEYAMEKDDKTGRSSVKKLGMAPVQRDGMEYEFTVFFDTDVRHYTTASKDRTGLFADRPGFTLTQEVGEELQEWNQSGAVDYTRIKTTIARHMKTIADARKQTWPVDQETFADRVKKYTNLDLTEENYKEIADKLSPLAADWKDNPNSEPEPETVAEDVQVASEDMGASGANGAVEDNTISPDDIPFDSKK